MSDSDEEFKNFILNSLKFKFTYEEMYEIAKVTFPKMKISFDDFLNEIVDIVINDISLVDELKD